MKQAELEVLVRECFGLEVVAVVRELAAGHINQSFVVDTGDGAVVVQQMNPQVFPDPVAVMDNAAKIRTRLEERNLPGMAFLRAVDGSWLADVGDDVWRCYRYIDGAATPPIVTVEEAQATARAFGRFAGAIDGLELVEHLPGYHDFDRRIAALEAAVEQDVAGRVADEGEIIESLLGAVDRVRLSAGFDAWREAPVRNAHNDAKGPNCVVGPSGARTIIDLDTTMRGTILSDVGELVRSSTRHLPEASPEQLMSQIEAVNRGFLASFGSELLESERQAMLVAGPLLTIENAARFLTDHFEGDWYYGASEPNQNRSRCEVQFSLALRIIEAIEWVTLH